MHICVFKSVSLILKHKYKFNCKMQSFGTQAQTLLQVSNMSLFSVWYDLNHVSHRNPLQSCQWDFVIHLDCKYI